MSLPTPNGEPPAGSRPGSDEPDEADDTVQRDPGSAGDTPDPDAAGPTGVTPAEAG